MINWEKTREAARLSDNPDKYAESEETTAPTSQKLVVWECEDPECDAPIGVGIREYEYNYARKKQLKALKENKPAVCQKCAHKHRRGKVSEKKGGVSLPLPPEVDRDYTFQEFGYYPEDLSPWSRKKVTLVYIHEDGQKTIHYASRAQLNTYVSVKETGHFKPTSVWTKERREGTKASEETKAKMRESQKMRRELEAKKEEEFKEKLAEQLSRT